MASPSLSQNDIQLRRPVWRALSELWLDTELTEDDIRHIAGVMVDSGYTLGELRVICDSEIAPVVYKNLLTPVGVWSGFDEEWLSQQIIKELDKPKRWQDALFDPIKRIFMTTTKESDWPRLVLAYREIKRSRGMIEL